MKRINRINKIVGIDQTDELTTIL